MSWVMKMTEKPSVSRSRIIWPRICRCTTTSSAVVGSSMMTTSGSSASAIAIITRCRMPPESWCGYAASRSTGDADQRQQLAGSRRSAAARVIAGRCVRSTSSIWVADGDHRVQRVHRALEHDRDLAPAQHLQLLLAQRQQVVALEQHLAGGHPPRRLQQPGRGIGQSGLAAAALPREAEHLASFERERDVVHGSQRAVVHREVADLQHRAHARTFRRRGFAYSSIPKLIRASAVPSSAMHRPAGTNHHHAPCAERLVALRPEQDRAPVPGRQADHADERQRDLQHHREDHRADETGGDHRGQVRQDLEDDDAPGAFTGRPRRQHEVPVPQRQRLRAQDPRAPRPRWSG